MTFDSLVFPLYNPGIVGPLLEIIELFLQSLQLILISQEFPARFLVS